MAGVSASHLIIFIASLVVAAGVVGTLTTGVDRVSSAIDDRSLDVSQQVRTDVAFVSDSGATSSYTAGENLTVHVRNTGSQGIPLEPSAMDLVFNGEFVSSSEFLVNDADGTDTVWRPGSVANITINSAEHEIQPDDNRLVLIVNEDEETFEFRAS